MSASIANYSHLSLLELARLRIAIQEQAKKTGITFCTKDHNESDCPSFRRDLDRISTELRTGTLLSNPDFLMRVWTISESILHLMKIASNSSDPNELANKMHKAGVEKSKEFREFQIEMAKLVEKTLDEMEEYPSKNNREKSQNKINRMSFIKVIAAERCFKHGLPHVYYITWLNLHIPKAKL
jgi:hypothetical protein